MPSGERPENMGEQVDGRAEDDLGYLLWQVGEARKIGMSEFWQSFYKYQNKIVKDQMKEWEK